MPVAYCEKFENNFFWGIHFQYITIDIKILCLSLIRDIDIHSSNCYGAPAICQAWGMVLGYWNAMVKIAYVIFSFAEYSWPKLAITKEYRLWFHIRGDLFY